MFMALAFGLAGGLLVSLAAFAGTFATASGTGARIAQLSLNSDGTGVITRTGSTTVNSTWAVNPFAGVGSQAWVKYTATLVTDTMAEGSYSPSTGVVSLSTNQAVSTTSSVAGGRVTVSYLVQIYGDSGGTNLLDSCTTVLDSIHS